MTGAFTVFGQAGTGSVAVEAALTLLGAPYSVEETFPRRGREWANPMDQVPALKLPDGRLLTESAAILIWLADAHPAFRLAPAPSEPDRPAFLRWMAFVASAIYAHYWALDDPAHLTANASVQAEIKSRLEDRIAQCWAVMEAGVAPATYLLGEDLSVLDLYVTVVSRWTPRRPFHETIAPGIGAVVRRVETDPRLAALWAQRFPLRED